MSEHRLSAAEKMLARLEKAAANFNIVGDGGINFAGNLKDGFTATLDGVSSSGQAPAAAAAVTVCEGDFEGTYTGPDESLIDVSASLPYDITVVWVEVDGTSTENTQVGYGAEGAGISLINFDAGPFIGVGGDVFRWTPSPEQPVPAGGYLQIGTGDWTDTDLIDGTIHYKIHYTYNCADAP